MNKRLVLSILSTICMTCCTSPSGLHGGRTVLLAFRAAVLPGDRL